MRVRRLLLVLLGLLASLPAAAQQRVVSVVANRAELLQLDRAPGSVLVANPAIADVVVEGGKQIFVLGRSPGETQLYVLDPEGRTLLDARISVLPPSSQHLTVIRGTDQGPVESTMHCAPRCAATGTVNVSPGGGAASPTAPPPAQ